MRGVKVNPEALRAIREKDGHPQLSLAKKSGVSQNRISELEGDEPQIIRPPTARALADALGVPMSAFLLAEAPAS